MGKLCKFENCLKTALYNYSSEIGAMFCKEHKDDNMINVTAKKCIEIGCTTWPSFGYPGGKMLYCEKHKENMVNPSTKKCIENGCIIEASFGYLNGKNYTVQNIIKKI